MVLGRDGHGVLHCTLNHYPGSDAQAQAQDVIRKLRESGTLAWVSHDKEDTTIPQD
jgi:hypothetical protein